MRIRRRIWLTWHGVFWILLAAVLLAQGWYRTIGLLSFLAFFLFGLLIVQVVYSVGFRRGLNQLRVVRRLPDAIVAGEPFFVELDIENPGRRQLGVRIEDQGDRTHWSVYVPQLRRGKKTVRSCPLVLKQRGWHSWSAIAVTTGFPLGLCRRAVIFEFLEKRLVFPAIGQVNRTHLESVLAVQLQRGAALRPWQRPLPGAEFEFHRLRDYRSGDSPRYVHWRSSARAGKLLVREMEPPASEDVVLVLEAWRPETGSAERRLNLTQPQPASQSQDQYPPLEEAVSLAASILVALNRNAGQRVALVVLESEVRVQVADTGTPLISKLLELLALTQGSSQLASADLAAALPFSLRHAPVIWITSRSQGISPQDLRLPVALLITAQEAARLGWYNPPAR